MCGIVGVVFKDPAQQVEQARLIASRDALAHRGPDAQGLWAIPGGAMAHRRLAILDLAPGHGEQPMVDAANTKALTYNGEVYNYRQLMADYEQRGHRFESTCDTELVFHALATDGPAAIEQFHGMFAFGYYDAADRKLLLVRDRLGQKPMYWHDTGDALIFASELKAILAYTGGRYDIDPAALEQFFTRGYVLSPRTIFRGIHKLSAGCKLTLDANNWSINIEQWWDASPQDLGELTDESVVDRLDELLSQSVADRLISDVPIGTLLSGGIDSSLITAMASKTLGQGVTAFTIGFDESEAHNEMPFAKMVADQYDCDWRARKVNQSESNWPDELDDASRYYDEPFGNFTVTSQRTLSKLCREELTVVLSGQGGDELSAGYPGRYNWVLQTQAQAADASKQSVYAPAVDDIANYLAKTSFLPWKNALSGMFSQDAAQAIISASEPTDGIAPFWGHSKNRFPGRLGNVLYTDTKTNLADYLICIEERASMSASLEARNPMLDHRVVEFMLSLPAQYKVRPAANDAPMAKDGLQNKWALHELSKRYLPREAFDRPKRGFTPPIQGWMQRSAPQVAELFQQTQPLTAGLYSPQWQTYLTAGQYAPGATMAVYYSLVFALWARRYADHIKPMSHATPSRRTAAPSLWHSTYREQAPEAMTAGRWFCQAMNNLRDCAAVQVVGDEDGYYQHLAEQTGVNVVDAGKAADGAVFIGLDAVQGIQGNDLPADSAVIVFIPFAQSDQPAVQAAMSKLNTITPIAGHQAVPVSASHAVLIARCTVQETQAATAK